MFKQQHFFGEIKKLPILVTYYYSHFSPFYFEVLCKIPG